MKVIEAGNLHDAISSQVVTAFPYIEERVFRGILSECIPEKGLIIETTEDELKGENGAGRFLYKDVQIASADSGVFVVYEQYDNGGWSEPLLTTKSKKEAIEFAMKVTHMSALRNCKKVTVSYRVTSLSDVWEMSKS